MSSGTPSFQAAMVELTRAFGWHRPSQTPCGQPVPVSEAHALVELSKSGPLTQKELGAALNLQKSSVSHLVLNLLNRGWVERSRNCSDGRVRDVSLTAEGKVAADRISRARRDKMSAILEQIPEKERPAVMRALKTLIGAIHESRV